MDVHQVIVRAAEDDAITDAALELQQELRNLGSSEIFALHIDAPLADRVHPLGQYLRLAGQKGADLLVYHASIGEPEVFSFLTERRERLALIWHNISPARHWAPFDPTFAALLETGHAELAKLAPRAVLAVADSQFNASELLSVGFSNVVVNHLVGDTNRLLSVSPDPDTAGYLSCFDGPTFLFVGEVWPHSRLDWLLSAYHSLVTYLETKAHLVLVGTDHSKPYGRALDSYIAELNLTNAHMMDRVSQESLVACYRAADVFVTASEHEGFSAPVIEAMAFDVPVLARACGGLPEILSGAGVLLDPEDSPLVAAEAMAVLAADQSLRAELVHRGRRRVREMDPGLRSSALVEQLRSVGA